VGRERLRELKRPGLRRDVRRRNCNWRRAIPATRIEVFLSGLAWQVQCHRAGRAGAAQHQAERLARGDLQMCLCPVRQITESGYGEQKYPKSGEQIHCVSVTPLP